MKIEILTFAGCPHREATVDRTREVLTALGVEAEVKEVEVRDGADAARLRFPGSPTIRIDGMDVEPDAEARGHDALSCRIYGGSGIPPRAQLVEAIAQAAARSGTGNARWFAAAGVPASGLAALPACPACYPLYAGALSALGLTLDPSAHLALTLGLVGIALGALVLRARARRGVGPLVLGVGAALGIVAGKLLLASDPMVYAGAAALTASCIWNAWPRSRTGAGCATCVSDRRGGRGAPSPTETIVTER